MNITPLPHPCQSSAVSAYINTLPYRAPLPSICYLLEAIESHTEKNSLEKYFMLFVFLCCQVRLVSYFNFFFKTLYVLTALII